MPHGRCDPEQVPRTVVAVGLDMHRAELVAGDVAIDPCALAVGIGAGGEEAAIGVQRLHVYPVSIAIAGRAIRDAVAAGVFADRLDGFDFEVAVAKRGMRPEQLDQPVGTLPCMTVHDQQAGITLPLACGLRRDRPLLLLAQGSNAPDGYPVAALTHRPKG
jgi:hypothetical protein